MTQFSHVFVSYICANQLRAEADLGAPLPPEKALFVFTIKICLPHQSVLPFLIKKLYPILRKNLDQPPWKCDTFGLQNRIFQGCLFLNHY